MAQEFLYEVGQRLIDEKRDITITEQVIKDVLFRRKGGEKLIPVKHYRYRCNRCGFDCGEHYTPNGEKRDFVLVAENDLKSGKGCGCCAGKVIAEGINDIPTTAPWMVQYFQGGYDEAVRYAKRSHASIFPVCPICGTVKNKPTVIKNIYGTKSIGCPCAGGVSYPEKFVFKLLSLCLNGDFTFQLTRAHFDWCADRRYDFYFKHNGKKYIVETHGKQHYQYTGFNRTLEQELENDRMKRAMALANGIDRYIVLDCRESTVEWIKNSVMSSLLAELFDLKETDEIWNECADYAETNLANEARKMWSSNKNADDIAEHFQLSKHTVYKYLKRGNTP